MKKIISEIKRGFCLYRNARGAARFIDTSTAYELYHDLKKEDLVYDAARDLSDWHDYCARHRLNDKFGKHNRLAHSVATSRYHREEAFAGCI